MLFKAYKGLCDELKRNGGIRRNRLSAITTHPIVRHKKCHLGAGIFVLRRWLRKGNHCARFAVMMWRKKKQAAG